MRELLQSVFGGAANYIKRFFGSKQFKQAQQAAKVVGDLLRYAIPAAEVISKMTPPTLMVGPVPVGSLDDTLVALAKRFLSAEDAVKFDLATATKRDVENLLFDSAAAVLRGDLAKAFQEAGEAGLAFGGIKFKAATDIPDSLIDQVVGDAYGFLHGSTKIGAANAA